MNLFKKWAPQNRARQTKTNGLPLIDIFGRFLLLASVILWLYSIFMAQNSLERGMNGFGLCSILPVFFYISFSLLTISFLINFRSQNNILFFCQVTLLILILNSTPFLIECTPRVTMSFYNYQAVDFISQNGTINAALQWIHNWPAFSIFYSALTQITGLSPNFIIGIYPTFINILLFLPLFLFFRLVFKDVKMVWMGIWVFYIANWVGQDYFSMQSAAILVLILFLYGLFRYTQGVKTNGGKLFLVLLFFFIYLVTSHVLTSLVALLVLIAFAIARYLKSPELLILFTAIFIAWTIYCAIAYLQVNGSLVLSKLFDLEQIFQANLSSRVTGSLEHQIVSQVRVIYTLVFAIFGIVSIILYRKNQKFNKIDKKIVLMLVAVILLMGFMPYGGEIMMRAFLFSLLPLAYFISKGIAWKPFLCIICIFLVVFVPVGNIVTHYGNEFMDYVPISETRGSDFLYATTDNGYLITPSTSIVGRIRDYNYYATYKTISFNNLEWFDGKFVDNAGAFRSDMPVFIVVTYYFNAIYEYYVGDHEFILETYQNITQSVNINAVYSNPNCDIYVQMR